MIYIEPCNCQIPMHNNGGNYHLRILVGDKYAVIWDTRESFSHEDGAFVLRRGGEVTAINRRDYEFDDYMCELQAYLDDGWEIVAQPSGASVVPVDAIDIPGWRDWYVEEI